MRTWLLWSLVAVLAWGLWGFFSAKASDNGSAHGLLAAAVLMEAVFVLPYVGSVPKSLSWWVVGVGAAGALAYYALFRALAEGGPPTGVVAITSLYPAITALLVVLFIGEEITVRKVLGVGLAIGAVVMISWES